MKPTHAFLLAALVAAGCLSPDLQLGEAMPIEDNDGGEPGVVANPPPTSPGASGQQSGGKPGGGGSTGGGRSTGGSAIVAGAGAGGSNAQGGSISIQGGEANATAGAAGGGAPTDCDAASTVHEDWSEPLGSSGSEWELTFGDPWVDVVNRRLVVTYDDIVTRRVDYEGGYYLGALVTLEGSTVLTPYPYVNEYVWPSVRRSSDGLGIDLGATGYGVTVPWSTDDWPGFSGSTITGTTQIVLITYVKASPPAFAVKVLDASSNVYRTDWISGFTWPDTNLGLLRFVGENNSNVYAGSDAVYVGPLNGCQNLTDAAVQQLFED
jgi:hypothetical protein